MEMTENNIYIYRQGDILLLRIGDLPASRAGLGRVVLRDSEVTGHAHVIERGRVLSHNGETPTTWTAADLLLDGPVSHRDRHGRGRVADHATIRPRPGRYRAIQQSEFAAGKLRPVAD